MKAIPTKLTNSPLCQQELRACRPNVSTYPFPFLLFFSLLHLVFSLILALISMKYRDVRLRYDDVCTFGSECELTFQLKKELKAPIYAYYELDGFYQNHFRFRGSRSYKQLAGKYLNEDDLSSCDPLISINSTVLAPCGLRTYYMFTDHFTLPYNFSYSGNTWQYEMSHLYPGVSNRYSSESRWMEEFRPIFTNDENELDERFAIWMRTSASSHFRKLFAKKLDDSLPANTNLTITIQMQYSDKIYDGPRYITLVTQSIAGGSNQFLIIINTAFGLIYVLAALIISCIRKRTFGADELLQSFGESAI